MAGDDFGARIDPGSLRKLVQASRTWDKVSRAEMRKGLRAAAAEGAEATRVEVRRAPPVQSRAAGQGKSRHRSTGLRTGLAKGVKVSIQTGRAGKDGSVKGEGVRVTTTSSGLPDAKAPMVKAYMAKQFRHPIFKTEKWHEQKGKNWFYNPLYKGRPQYQKAVVDAIEAASKAIGKD